MHSLEPRLSVGSVVALKPAVASKSRLGSLPAPLRQRLAECMALDTLSALAAATDHLLVVGDDPTLAERLRRNGIRAEVVGEPTPGGMNSALRLGDQLLAERGCDRVLSAVGDLPALTPDVVRDLVARTTALPRGYVADHTGYGTTMLIAEAGQLDPRFQGASAEAHRSSGAVPVEDPDPRLTSDVDAVDDLGRVIALGVGRHTATLVADSVLGDYVGVTVAGPAADHGEPYVVITDAGVRMLLPDRALDPQVSFLRPGQRLHAVTDGARLLSAWV